MLSIAELIAVMTTGGDLLMKGTGKVADRMKNKIPILSSYQIVTSRQTRTLK